MDRVSSVVVAMLVAVAVMPGASSEPQPARVACDGWEWVKVPRAGDMGDLYDIAVLSPDDAWAVGSLGDDAVVASLAIHWNGEVWERAPFPTVGPLESVAVAGSGEVWAVGHRDPKTMPDLKSAHLLTARWSGERWDVVPTGITTPGTLLDVAPIPGTQELWAVGYESAGAPLAIHWTGRRWRHAPIPVERGMLEGVVAFRHSAWAVGHRGGQVLALRWNGERWRSVDAPRGWASSIDGVRPNRLWAVGNTPYPEHPAIFRWNGEHWRTVWTGAEEGMLHDLIVPAPGVVVWAVGMGYGDDDPPLVVRLGPDGWRVTTTGGDPGYLTAIDGTAKDLWTTWISRSAWGVDPPFFGTYHRC